MAIHSPEGKRGSVVRFEADSEMNLFVRDPSTGRLVFNSKAIEALGLSPVEVRRRGYLLDGEITSPATVPEDQPPNVVANG